MQTYNYQVVFTQCSPTMEDAKRSVREITSNWLNQHAGVVVDLSTIANGWKETSLWCRFSLVLNIVTSRELRLPVIHPHNLVRDSVWQVSAT